MTAIAKVHREEDFLRKLYDVLLLNENFQLESEGYGGADIVVRNRASGKTVGIELKNAGDYGELPISTILPISRMVKQNDTFEKLLLITFSQVPMLLSKKLQELNVETLTKPTVEQVVGQVEQAFAG
jgi:hypothetical protein